MIISQPFSLQLYRFCTKTISMFLFTVISHFSHSFLSTLAVKQRCNNKGISKQKGCHFTRSSLNSVFRNFGFRVTVFFVSSLFSVWFMALFFFMCMNCSCCCFLLFALLWTTFPSLNCNYDNVLSQYCHIIWCDEHQRTW